MINYFVFCVYVIEDAYGYCNCIYESPNKITNYDDILSMEKQIQKQKNLPNLPLVVNFKGLPND